MSVPPYTPAWQGVIKNVVRRALVVHRDNIAKNVIGHQKMIFDLCHNIFRVKIQLFPQMPFHSAYAAFLSFWDNTSSGPSKEDILKDDLLKLSFEGVFREYWELLEHYYQDWCRKIKEDGIIDNSEISVGFMGDISSFEKMHEHWKICKLLDIYHEEYLGLYVRKL